MIHIKGTEKTIQFCESDLVELSAMSEERRLELDRKLKELNARVANGEKVMYRTICEELGIPVDGYDPELLDFWGFDKKGFRQMYQKKVIITIVPID